IPHPKPTLYIHTSLFLHLLSFYHFGKKDSQVGAALPTGPVERALIGFGRGPHADPTGIAGIDAADDRRGLQTMVSQVTDHLGGMSAVDRGEEASRRLR